MLYDSRDGEVFDTGLAVAGASSAVLNEEVLVLLADEESQGADLDGDGERDHEVVHIVQLQDHAIENLRITADSASATAQLVLIERLEETDEVDWNRDGDRDDEVLFVLDRRTGRVHNTAVASTGFVLGASDDRVLFSVSEFADGRDWNGDGDRADFVHAIFDVGTGHVTSLGLAGESGQRIGERFVVLVDEAAQGQDLDQDGDQTDTVPFVVE